MWRYINFKKIGMSQKISILHCHNEIQLINSSKVLFGKIVKDMEVDFNMTTREKAVFGCLKAEHAQDFLLAIPIDGLGQHMSPIEYRTILRYRLIFFLAATKAIYINRNSAKHKTCFVRKVKLQI
jgi:hypothetical protein